MGFLSHFQRAFLEALYGAPERVLLKTLTGIVERFATNNYRHRITPENVSNFEEAFNNFLVREGASETGKYTFKLHFSCKKVGRLVIEEVQGFNKKGERVM